MFQLSDKSLRIEAARGVLIVMDGSNKPHRINEASMIQFEEFYALWTVAIQLMGEETTFINAWCFADGFKATMIDAMKVLGFEDPTVFSPSQLEALLIQYPDPEAIGGVKAGVLFGFHQTYPKLTQKAMTPGTTSGTMPRKPMISISLEFTPIKNWLAIARSKVGRYLESCATWLLQDSSKSQPTPSDEKK